MDNHKLWRRDGGNSVVNFHPRESQFESCHRQFFYRNTEETKNMLKTGIFEWIRKALELSSERSLPRLPHLPNLLHRLRLPGRVRRDKKKFNLK